MFCPKCRYEYKDDVTECPDCNVALVSELPKEELPEEIKDWVQVARLNSLQEAEMIEESLREKNIRVVIQSGTGYFGYIGVMGATSYGPVGGGYSVYVPKDEIVEADREATLLLGDEWIKSRLIDIEIETDE